MTNSGSEIHQKLQSSLSEFRDPETGRPFSKTGQVSNWSIADGHVRCRLALSTHSSPIAEETAEQFRDFLLAQSDGIQSVEVELATIERPSPPTGQFGLRIKSIVLVGSGKGGVGKSTMAASLALTLERLGAKVGLMDADVYGPSIPHLLGRAGRPAIVEGKIEPIRHGTMPVMSMGFLVERDQAVIFRGPMLHGSIVQFLRDTNWGDLDYLVIDLPPGTGDVALSLSQSVPIAGAVVVCTPQEVALLDAVKAISMFRKTKIPILGIVENMSGFTCPDCNKTYDIFGKGGARTTAEEYNIPFLGAIPINIGMRESSDEGELSQVIARPDCRGPIFGFTRAVVRSLADQARSGGGAVPLPVLG